MRSPRSIAPSIPRPHSADFLDYEARHPLNQGAGSSGNDEHQATPHRTPRPKSSLDINRTPDHYYYSEASYAEKMRLQSASYLQRAANNSVGSVGVSRKQRSDDTQGTVSSRSAMACPYNACSPFHRIVCWWDDSTRWSAVSQRQWEAVSQHASTRPATAPPQPIYGRPLRHGLPSSRGWRIA